ncbi:jg15594 [Pararge aegeria aegeria]|uniref:Jg15594 protein n=1 Tax=Pararge aegeria aegeria TaxID=348720 RepID=A0A8S4RUA0_9NEOP|nr:jg15594 [Pararge aegeria aegeria]
MERVGVIKPQFGKVEGARFGQTGMDNKLRHLASRSRTRAAQTRRHTARANHLQDRIAKNVEHCRAVSVTLTRR